MQILKITDLTLGEILELERTSHYKETQKDYARRLRVSEGTVYNWESGKTKVARKYRDVIEQKRDKLRKYLTLSKQCYFARKRFGKTQQQVANNLGFSRYWVLLMEQGSVPVDKKMIDYFSPGTE